jgi:serine/threonine-protein kinase
VPILSPEERVGSLLAGRYRLESILGTGGTSVVYRANHAWTGKTVALKLLKPEHARDRNLVMRFLREARSASTLVHPNVVTILDMGTDPGGEVYLAMELVHGEPLGALLDREGSLSPERALELLRPVMEALAVAHQTGIVHRDLKPDNILIGDRGDGVVRPILLDFGMAKMTEAAWGHATQSGLIVGTPFYMSPEQAEGASDVGPASDVWSMGVILYRCLGGSLPFFGTAPTSLLLAIVRGDHVPLGERAPSVPIAFASVVERALRVNRAERYPDMTALIAAIDAALEGKVDPLTAPPPPPEESAVEEPVGPRRSRKALAVAALVLVTCAIAGTWVWVGRGGEPVARANPPPIEAAPAAPRPASVATDPAPPVDRVAPPLAVASTPEPADVEAASSATEAEPDGPVRTKALPIRRRVGGAGTTTASTTTTTSTSTSTTEAGGRTRGAGLATEW